MDHLQITAQAVAEAVAIERKRSSAEIEQLRTQVVKAFADAKGRAGVVLSEENDRLIDEIERLRAHVSDALAVLNACRITIKNRDQRPDEMKLLDAIKIVIANAEDVLGDGPSHQKGRANDQGL